MMSTTSSSLFTSISSVVAIPWSDLLNKCSVQRTVQVRQVRSGKSRRGQICQQNKNQGRLQNSRFFSDDISKEIGKGWRIFSVYPQSRSLFSDLFDCLHVLDYAKIRTVLQSRISADQCTWLLTSVIWFLFPSDKNDKNSKTGKDEQYTKVIMGKIWHASLLWHS